MPKNCIFKTLFSYSDTGGSSVNFLLPCLILLSCTVEKVEKNAYAPKILKYNFPYNSHLLTYEDTSYQEWKALFGMHFVSYSEILEALNHALLSI